MKEKKSTYADLIELAEKYGVSNNALFVSAAHQYELQSQILDMIRASLIDGGETIVTKEYVKGRENVCAHPLIQQLPKHIDSANKTLATMLDIVQKLGTPPAVGDKLKEFLADE